MTNRLLPLILVLFAQSGWGQTGWESKSLVSPMGDNSGIILTAKQLPVLQGSAIAEGTGLSIQCSKKNGLEVILATGQFLKESGNVSDKGHRGELGGLFSKHPNATLSRVRIRFDQQKATPEEWMLGANTSNLFAQKPKKFIDALLKDQVQELVFESRPVNDNPAYFKFDVRGLADHRAELHDNCGY